VRSDFGLLLGCSLWERPLLELACPRFVDATDFRYDSLEEDVGRDGVEFESEGPLCERDGLDSPSDGLVCDD
jgi:hypothetical protein